MGNIMQVNLFFGRKVIHYLMKNLNVSTLYLNSSQLLIGFRYSMRGIFVLLFVRFSLTYFAGKFKALIQFVHRFIQSSKLVDITRWLKRKDI